MVGYNSLNDEIVMYHVSHQGQQFGPYTVEQINQYHAQGAFDASSHVGDANANGWIEIWQLPGVVLPTKDSPPKENETNGVQGAVTELYDMENDELDDDIKTSWAIGIAYICAFGVVFLCYVAHVRPPISWIVGVVAAVIYMMPFMLLEDYAKRLYKRGTKVGALVCRIAIAVIAPIILLYVYRFLSDELPPGSRIQFLE
jgi:hypothetical protein